MMSERWGRPAEIHLMRLCHENLKEIIHTLWRFEYDERPTKTGNPGSPLYLSSGSTVHSDGGGVFGSTHLHWRYIRTKAETMRKEESRDHHEYKYRV